MRKNPKVKLAISLLVLPVVGYNLYFRWTAPKKSEEEMEKFRQASIKMYDREMAAQKQRENAKANGQSPASAAPDTRDKPWLAVAKPDVSRLPNAADSPTPAAFSGVTTPAEMAPNLGTKSTFNYDQNAAGTRQETENPADLTSADENKKITGGTAGSMELKAPTLPVSTAKGESSSQSNLPNKVVKYARTHTKKIQVPEIFSSLGVSYLPPGSDEVGPDQRAFLAAIAERLKQFPNYEGIDIQGFVDAKEGQSVNFALATRRALLVKGVFVEQGLPARKISVKGLGSQKPIGSSETEAGRALNRRVEIRIINWDRPIDAESSESRTPSSEPTGSN